MTALLLRCVLAGSIGLAACGCTGTEVETTGAQAATTLTTSTIMPIADHSIAATKRPAIDLDAPATCRTATFALG